MCLLYKFYKISSLTRSHLWLVFLPFRNKGLTKICFVLCPRSIRSCGQSPGSDLYDIPVGFSTFLKGRLIVLRPVLQTFWLVTHGLNYWDSTLALPWIKACPKQISVVSEVISETFAFTTWKQLELNNPSTLRCARSKSRWWDYLETDTTLSTMATDKEELFNETSPVPDPLSVACTHFPVAQALSQLPPA